MNDETSSGPDATAGAKPAARPPAKVYMVASTRASSVLRSSYETFEPVPPPEPPFWTKGWFKVIFLGLVAGAIGGWNYYHFYWLSRVPQDYVLTSPEGKPLQVRIEGHDNVLLKYTLPGSETIRYLSLATLLPSDQAFIVKLDQSPLARLPFACTLTDAVGKQTAVNVMAHNDDWAQCALVSDGSTHYISLSTLIPADQAVLRLLPSDLSLRFPVNYTLTGGPDPGTNVQLLGRNDNTVEYLDLATGKKIFKSIAELAALDQSFVREFPNYLADQPPATTGSRLAGGDRQGNLVNAAQSKPDSYANRNGPITAGMLKALVVIKGDYSTGSGFIAKLHGQTFVVTNQHILSGNKEFTITDMDGNKLPTTGPLYGAVGYDVAILKIPDTAAASSLNILADPQNNAKVGDQVTVPGNSPGTRTPTQFNCQLTAIGPDSVEISAQLEAGLSGSPIIDRSSGKVLGIATMSLSYKTDSTTSGITPVTQWFGYRVDNINPDTGWIKMDWARFRDEGSKIRNAMDLFMSLDALLRDKPAADISSPIVRAAIADFQAEVDQAVAHHNKQDIQAAFQTFNSKLRSLANNSTNELSRDALYPYHANIAKGLDDLRKYLDLAFQDDSRKYENLVQVVQ